MFLSDVRSVTINGTVKNPISAIMHTSLLPPSINRQRPSPYFRFLSKNNLTMTKKRKTMDQEVHVDLTLETSPFAVKTVEKNDYLELEKSLALRLAKFPPGCRTLKLFLKNNFVHVSMHVVQDVLIYLPTREIAYRVSNDGLFHHSSATTLAVESDLNFSHGTPVRWKRKKGNEFEAGIILTAPFKSQATGEFHVYHIMDLQNRVHRIPLPFVHYRVEQEISPPPQPPTSVSLPLVHKDRKCGTAIKPLVIARPPTLDESQKPPSIAIQEGKCADGTEVDQNERKLSPVKSLDVPPIQDDEIIGKMPQKKVKSDLSSEFVSPPSLTSEREVLAKEDTTHPQSNPMHDDEIVKLPRKELTRVLSSEAPMPLSITNERNICAQEHITHSYSRTSPVNSLEVPQIQANSGVQPPRNKMKFTLFSKGPRPANLSSESNVFAQEDITDPNCSTSPVDAPQMQPNDIVQLSRKKVKSALSSKASRYPNLTCGRNVLEQKDTPRSKSVVRTIYIPYCVQVDIFQVKGTSSKHSTRAC
jgi:hypothetical protein